MGSIFETLFAVPLIAWIVILILLTSALWTAMHVLFIRPRDFRIETLESEVKKLNSRDHKTKSLSDEITAGRDIDETRSTTKSTSKQIGKTGGNPDESTETAILGKDENNISDPRAEGLRNMQVALDLINDDTVTDLQLQNVHEYFVGKNVIWRSEIRSVGKPQYGFITVVVREVGEASFRSAFARFKDTEQSKLVNLNQGDTVIVTGVILEVFNSTPILNDCTIAKAS